MCRTKIERVHGCNHMTCLFCGYEFCWVCGREADARSGHWGQFSVTGCGAPQLGQELNPKDLKKLQRKRCNLLFIAFIFLPVILVLATPVFLSIIWLDCTEKKHMSAWLRYGLTPLIFVCGIPLTLIAVPCALVYALFYLVRTHCLCCCKKNGNASKNKLMALERIKELTEENNTSSYFNHN